MYINIYAYTYMYTCTHTYMNCSCRLTIKYTRRPFKSTFANVLIYKFIIKQESNGYKYFNLLNFIS